MNKTLLAGLLFAQTISVHAQISITATGVAATVDITDFTGAGFQPGGGGGTLNSDIFAAQGFSTGDVDFGGTALDGDLARGSAELGTITTGGIYALPLPTPNHIWIQPTSDDFTPGAIIMRIQNNTAVTLGEMLVAYTVFAYNDEDRSNKLICGFSTNNIDYTDIPESEYISPDSADDNFYEVPVEVLATGFSVPPGEFLYVRLFGDDVGGSGSRDEFGFNGISFIANEAAATPVYNFSPESLTVNESAGATSVELSISESADCTMTFGYDPASTATPAFDYGLGLFTYTFTAGGPTTATIDIGIVDDLTTEPLEYGIIYINDVAGGCIPGATPATTIFIEDNDSIVPPIATFTTVGVTETESVGSVFGTIELSEPADCVFQLYLDGASTMENGLDYSYLLPTFITFTAAGATTNTFEIPIIDDIAVESTELLLINMISWTGGCITAGITDYEINITDDDVASIPTVAFVVDADIKSETDALAVTNVVISEAADCTVEITASPSSTATNGLDYSLTLPTEVEFTTGGLTVISVNTTLIDDAEIEPTENLILQLEVTAGSCTTGGITTHTITITNDDEVAINDLVSDGLSVSPNPATTTISINGADGIRLVRILDMQGNLVAGASENQVIDIQHLPAGNYVIIAETSLGTGTTHFIKQ